MSAATPTRANPAHLIYGGDLQPTEASVYQIGEDTSNTAQADGYPEHSTKRISMYVELFEDMVRTVLGSERHLFSHDEIGYFKLYNKLSYEARYLLVRLSLRKVGKWFRLCELDRYRSELGEHIPEAIDELCANAKLQLEHSRKVTVKVEEKDIVIPDIKDEKCNIKSEVQDFKVKVGHPEAGPSDNSFESAILAENEECANLPELLDCLNFKELQALAQSMKLKFAAKRRDEIITMLQDSASKQSTLAFHKVPSKAKLKGKNSNFLAQSQLTFSSNGQSQLDRLGQMAMIPLVKCIRINDKVIGTLRRLHLIYYRCTQYSPDFLTPSILARSKKRSYAKYEFHRTSDIWSSRDAFMDYEQALHMEFEIDQTQAKQSASSDDARGRSLASRTPVPPNNRSSATPSTPGPITRRPPSIRAAGSPTHVRVKGKGTEEQSPRVRNALLVKEIFESVYPTWKSLLHVKPDPRKAGLERFDCGHVLTRIVCKGANALKVLKEYEYELEVLEALLSQKHWRKAKRGGWHDRRALILMTHMPKDAETQRAAMDAAKEGLDDPDTHTVWRPKLQHRLATLEKQLKVPSAESRDCEIKLEKAKEITIIGKRIYRADVIHRDNMHRTTENPPPPLQTLATDYFQASTKTTQSSGEVKVKTGRATGKSIWKGKDDEEVSVETFALQHYGLLGYKGYHCEGSALYTIFGLLFWDIIFAPIPGAFETRYQAAPLDIIHDSFYFSRQDMIENRLAEIRGGGAREILETTDKKYRKTKTCCVGVGWDRFARQDLLEIVDCIGGPPLSAVCRIVCEDYWPRASGLPDLVIWDTTREDNRCMFVEVKGPGDTLQENQKTWINLLILAKVPVEVCHVAEESGVRSKKRKAKKTVKKRPYELDSEGDQPKSEDGQSSPTARKRVALSQATSARKKRKLELQLSLPTGARPISPEL